MKPAKLWADKKFISIESGCMSKIRNELRLPEAFGRLYCSEGRQDIYTIYALPIHPSILSHVRIEVMQTL